MNSKTSLVASKVRLREWALQIQECNNRPSGMDVATWCAQHNLTKANYYYRLRRVREACLDLIEDPALPPTPFVELPVPMDPPADEVDKEVPRDLRVAATVVLPNGLRIELQDTASKDFLKSLLEASAYVK